MKTAFFFSALFLFLATHASYGSEANTQLKFRSLTKAEEAAIQHHVTLVQENLGPASNVDFKFSEESIKWLDGYIERNRKKGPTDALEQVIASYLGETIRINYQCKWAGINEGVGLQCPGELTVLPLNKVSKQFESGHEHSVYDFYLAIPALIKEARERQQGNTK